MRHHPLCSTATALILGYALAAGGLFGQTAKHTAPATASVSIATEDRLAETGAGWWPTKGVAPRSSFIGNEACRQCHAGIMQSQLSTPMAQAGHLAGDADILRKLMPLSQEIGPYSYRISREVGGPVYSVANGSQTSTAPLAWAFGSGELGQTYVYRQSESWHESRLSFFTRIGKLDITIGHSPHTPESVDAALGVTMKDETAQRCFGCHTTASTASTRFEPQNATPGITCEGCHGPGADHVANMTSGARQTAIANPAHMTPVDSVDFCGACHRTTWDVTLSGVERHGVEVVRFQPYRLEESRCWGASGDRRITCIACHDPHQPLVREAAAYDNRCLSCHRLRGEAKTAAKPGAACPSNTSNCANCHMPKYTVAGMHGDFTDHFIRIVRRGEEFPQ